MRQATLLVVNTATSVVRLLAGLFVGLLTTPLLLWQLGLEGFGVLVTVGASGVFFTMVTETLQVSTARDLAYCLGTKKKEAMQEAFSSALALQGVAGLLVMGLGCLVTPWLAEWLTIPEGQHRAVFWCLLLTFAKLGGGIVASTYGGLIAAHQDLRIKSMFDFLTRLTNLVAAAALCVLPGNKLLLFVALGFLLSVLIWIAMTATCLARYPESVPRPSQVRLGRIRQMLSYGSLAFLGRMSAQLRMQGASVYYNIVFGNNVTAANGVALRLGGLVRQFLGVLIPVIQPALTVRTGAGDAQATRRLVTLTSGLSLALSLSVAVPILVDAELLLSTWLGTYPDMTPLFVRCFCLSLVFGQLSVGHNLAVHARGDIGSLVLGNQLLLLLPVIAAAVVAWSTHSRPWLLPVTEVFGTLAATACFQPLWAGRKLQISYAVWVRESVLPWTWMVVSTGLFAWGTGVLIGAHLVRPLVLFVGSALLSAAVCWRTVFNEREQQILRMLALELMGRVRRMPQP